MRDHLSIYARDSASLLLKPFLWCDPWGYGLGIPFWIPAFLLTALAVRRYAVTSVRLAPPRVRFKRWQAATWTLAAALAFFAMGLSVDHRAEPIWTETTSASLKNGALVVTRFKDQQLTQALNTPGGSTLFGLKVRPFESSLAESRIPFELVPAFESLSTGWQLALPLWPAAALSAWLAVRAVRRAHFRGPGACSGCGYDRSGLSNQAVCPECGTPLETVIKLPTA